ncbi:hypothetical protein [Alteraurantiacibacter palmitatis]|uniref:Uncharacterized protein n=1 Tax=Alteraurantiacibacter palmitatis TaxID=2054628 RepID=A0ABV7E5X7_9SPHN
MNLPFNPFGAIAAKIYSALLIAAAAAALVQTLRIEGVWCREVAEGERSRCLITGFVQDVADRDVTIAQRTAERDAEITQHLLTKQAYTGAQAEAARLESERLERVQNRQQEITNATIDDYRRRLAAARADAERLRQRASTGTGSSGAAAGIDLPGLPVASGRADASASDRGFPLAERLTATEQAIQLDELISWIEAQARVDPNE